MNTDVELGAVLRHVSQYVAGLITAYGIWDKSMEETAVGVAIGLVTLGIYFYKKWTPAEPKA